MSPFADGLPSPPSARKSMPIVFCPSLVPCESEKRLPVMICPYRYERDTELGRWRPTIRYTIRMPIPAATNASGGAIRPGMTPFSTSPEPITALDPSAANAEPTTPPISACEDDDGSPKYHVSRFQKIAPMRPAKTIGSVIMSALTMPLAIVAATASERNAPTKLSTEDSPTATRGDIARVEIDVATAFAVSWNPLVKSNASAVATTIQRTTSLSIKE